MPPAKVAPVRAAPAPQVLAVPSVPPAWNLVVALMTAPEMVPAPAVMDPPPELRLVPVMAPPPMAPVVVMEPEPVLMVPFEVVMLLPLVLRPPGMDTARPLRPRVTAVVVAAVPMVRAVVVVPASIFPAKRSFHTVAAAPRSWVLLALATSAAPMLVEATLLRLVLAPVPEGVAQAPPVMMPAVSVGFWIIWPPEQVSELPGVPATL